jgi:DNA-binding GntR family transcriptional regulator
LKSWTHPADETGMPPARTNGPDAPPRRLEKGRGREFVYLTLKRQIVALKLAPGSELDEGQLGTEIGVSRTPLREALVRLASEGLVVLMPNRGARVAPMDIAHVQEHLEAFDLMQRVTTRWAAQRRSDQDLDTLERLRDAFDHAKRRGDADAMIDINFSFHQAIGEACGNRNFAKVYAGLLSENLRIARLAMAYECYGSAEAFEDHMARIVREHHEIVAAIRRKDADAAERLAASHSGLARKRVLEYLSVSMVDGFTLQPAAPEAAI